MVLGGGGLQPHQSRFVKEGEEEKGDGEIVDHSFKELHDKEDTETEQ